MTETNEKIKRRNKWLEISAWALAIVLLIAALVYYNFLAPYEERMSLKDCPQFSVRLYNREEEQTFDFSEYEGKVVVINFWATYCAPCVAEIPHFEKLQQKYSDDIVVIALHHESITVGGPNGVQSFIDAHGWGGYQMYFAQDTATSTTIINDEEAETKTELYKALGGADTLPHTVIVDVEGKVAYTRTGSVTYESLEEEMLKVLNN